MVLVTIYLLRLFQLFTLSVHPRGAVRQGSSGVLSSGEAGLDVTYD